MIKGSLLSSFVMASNDVQYFINPKPKTMHKSKMWCGRERDGGEDGRIKKSDR